MYSCNNKNYFLFYITVHQKGKKNLDFTGARNSERQWYQLGHMQVCTSLQTDNHASTSLLKFFTGRMPFLPPNQQCQSTEGNLSQQNLCQKNSVEYIEVIAVQLVGIQDHCTASQKPLF